MDRKRLGADTTLRSFQPLPRALISLHALTAVTATPGEWMSRLEEQKSATERVTMEQARAAHERWWAAFWDRSWIRVLGPDDAGWAAAPEPAAQVVNRGYALPRFLNAGAGRGAFPIKFNGSIFTVDVPGKYDAHYRQWGGCYWFQNTRLPSWAMLASGDLDLLPPLFRMYLDALPLARERTRLYYQHDGAFFAETMNPELYAIFPFRLFGVGKPDLEAAQTAFARRAVQGNRGGQQDDTQAAFLGRAQEAARMVSNRLATQHAGSRFPAFWGPNFDWIPDQDHGGNALMALQTMLLQTEGRRLLLFPAWPRNWDVEFKLHAPLNTTVEGVWRQGKIERLAVQPPERERDVVRSEPQ